MMRSRSALETGRAVWDIVREEEIPFLAAAIAYFGFVSLLPALLLAVAVASTIGGESLVEQVLEISSEFLTPAGRDALGEALTSARGRSGATIIGIALLLWSALRVFKGLDIAFSRVYGTSGSESLLGQIRDALIVLVTIGIGLWTMIVGGGILATLVPASENISGFILLLVTLSIVFFPLFYVFPDTDITIREALPGTVLTAVGWVLLQAGFQVYAGTAIQFQLYGVIGGMLLLVTWFYLAAILVLLGAALNRVLAG